MNFAVPKIESSMPLIPLRVNWASSVNRMWGRICDRVCSYSQNCTWLHGMISHIKVLHSLEAIWVKSIIVQNPLYLCQCCTTSPQGIPAYALCGLCCTASRTMSSLRHGCPYFAFTSGNEPASLKILCTFWT